MKKKMNKKTRNVVSGILVSIAAIFAVINFADIPASDVQNFILSTAIFFIAIVLLALLAVSIFKFFGWLKNSLIKTEANDDIAPDDNLNKNQSQDLSGLDDHSQDVRDSHEK